MQQLSFQPVRTELPLLDQLSAFYYMQMAWGYKVETQVTNLKSISEFCTPYSDGGNRNVNNNSSQILLIPTPPLKGGDCYYFLVTAQRFG